MGRPRRRRRASMTHLAAWAVGPLRWAPARGLPLAGRRPRRHQLATAGATAVKALPASSAGHWRSGAMTTGMGRGTASRSVPQAPMTAPGRPRVGRTAVAAPSLAAARPRARRSSPGSTSMAVPVARRHRRRRRGTPTTSAVGRRQRTATCSTPTSMRTPMAAHGEVTATVVAPATPVMTVTGRHVPMVWLAALAARAHR